MESPKTARRGRPPDPERRARMRERILEAAARAFARHGFAETGVDEVAALLGVGKATVYRHFPHKGDLLLAAADMRMVQLRKAVDRSVAGCRDPLESVRLAARAYLGFCDAHPDVVDLIVQERAAFPRRRRTTYFQPRDENLKPWNDLFRGLMDAGVVRRMPPSRITDVLGDALYGTMVVNHFSGRRRSLDRQTRDLLDVAFRGILARPARGPGPRRKGSR